MKTTFIKENHFTGAGLQFQVCLLRYQHGRKHSRHARRHGAGQKLKVLHLAPQAARRERATGCGLCFWNLIVHPQQHTLPTRPHFRATPSDQAFKCMNPLGHSYSNHQLWKSLVKCCDRVLKNNDKEKKSLSTTDTISPAILLLFALARDQTPQIHTLQASTIPWNYIPHPLPKYLYSWSDLQN